MEGMVSKDLSKIQQHHLIVSGSQLSIAKWCQKIITKLLEVAHRQWIYRNSVVYDRMAGDTASKRKEEIQMEIEKQQELRDESLLEDSTYLMEMKLNDLENSSGEQEEYWLMVIRAAWNACALMRHNTNNTASPEPD